MNNSFVFFGTITRPVLEQYLSHAVTMADILHSATLEDDLRMIRNIGAKFLGRAASAWMPDGDDDAHFALAAQVAEKVHLLDDEIVLQAAIYESVFENVALIPIPGWVFAEFALPDEGRTFNYQAMLFPDGRHVGQWGKRASVPDIRQLETQLWFFYRAARYLRAGFEALHLGQVHLYSSCDRGYLAMASLLERIRRYARAYARRGMVLCDAHTNGIVIHGHLLFDIHATILFLREIADQPQRVAILPHGESLGGIAPSGWSCNNLPYLAEFDNYGGQITTAPESIHIRKADGEEYRPGEVAPGVLWPWGYDEIAWFAHQPEELRNSFLRYAWHWFAVNDRAGFLQMPVRRGLGSAPVNLNDAGAATPHKESMYQANTRSADCLGGFNQEATIRTLWGQSSARGADEPLSDTQPHITPYYIDAETGFQYPTRIALVGTIQSALGGQAWEPMSELTRMSYHGDGRYYLRCCFPAAGTYHFRITVAGSWTENYGVNCIADGENYQLTIIHPGEIREFLFDYMQKSLTIIEHSSI